MKSNILSAIQELESGDKRHVVAHQVENVVLRNLVEYYNNKNKNNFEVT